ncbi:MAG TPA: OsmC family peroxiredoxin [Longimicrobium sp.]|nr:OsmC family peroxiredoxin [Longimicrobium sp.]
MPTRKASATWEGGLRGGNGSFRGESGVLDGAYSFGSRFTDAGGTNPEELLAAAEAACFSMALAAGLENAGTPATRVHTDAACTVEKVEEGFKITTMRLRTTASVPGVDDATFQKFAQDTKKNCVVSKALAAIDIQLEATLES